MSSPRTDRLQRPPLHLVPGGCTKPPLHLHGHHHHHRHHPIEPIRVPGTGHDHMEPIKPMRTDLPNLTGR